METKYPFKSNDDEVKFYLSRIKSIRSNNNFKDFLNYRLLSKKYYYNQLPEFRIEEYNEIWKKNYNNKIF